MFRNYSFLLSSVVNVGLIQCGQWCTWISLHRIQIIPVVDTYTLCLVQELRLPKVFLYYCSIVRFSCTPVSPIYLLALALQRQRLLLLVTQALVYGSMEEEVVSTCPPSSVLHRAVPWSLRVGLFQGSSSSSSGRQLPPS